MSLIEVKPIDVSQASQAQSQADLMLTNAQNIVINNQHHYEQAATFLKTVKEKYKQLDEMRKKITKPLDVAKRAVMDLFSKPQSCLIDAETMTKKAMLTFINNQEKIRLERERKLQQEADRKRQEALKKAETARANGQEVKAEKYEDKANGVVAPVLAPRVEQVKGIAMKKIWKFKITREDDIPRNYMIPNVKLLGEIARAGKGTITIPGIMFYAEDTVAAGK